MITLKKVSIIVAVVIILLLVFHVPLLKYYAYLKTTDEMFLIREIEPKNYEVFGDFIYEVERKTN